MKESIGSTQLYIIVITMVLLFTGILAFAMNRANAFAVKNQIVSIIEANDGYAANDPNSPVIESIVKAMAEKQYNQLGSCEKEEEMFKTYSQKHLLDMEEIEKKKVGVFYYKRDGNEPADVNSAAFCVVKTPVTNGDVTRYYYRVVIFYSIDVPILKTLLTFRDIGETKILNN